jgi:hypothetical protein
MTQVIAILDPETLSLRDWYFADSPYVPVTPGIRLEVPEGLTWDVVKGVAAEDGTIQLQEDPVRVQDHKAALWSQLRLQRDSLLSASDWRVLPFSPLTQEQQQAWADYRSALRALPQLTQDPSSVAWPSPPSSP